MTEEWARDELLELFDHVVGKESSAWDRWIRHASADPIRLRTALTAALLSLGAPPHPCFLTQDLTEIILSTAPPRRTEEEVARYIKWKNVVDRQWRRQQPYNHALNNFAHDHELVYTHKTQDPAQFRKLFAAFLDLHACKVKEITREIRTPRRVSRNS